MATERELKFSTADDHVPSTLELGLALQGSGLTVGPGTVSRHVDVYHDSQGQLAAAGMALRARRSSAGSRVTLKSGAGPVGEAGGAMHRRSELELRTGAVGAGPDSVSAATVPAAAWPERVLAALPSGLAIERLAPVAELHVRRVAFLISDASGSRGGVAFAELAFDEVTCVMPQQHGATADAATAQFYEVEIEWLGADDAQDDVVVASLATVAEAVGTIINLTASPVAKLDRARALLAALDAG